ncbi:endoglucanase [Rhodoblastus acidophilus]|uniref:glycosyl hydrolase family 8 n=1 Tax=Rhodoblastus acidophilus TaxID=1074 RepID=UPI002224B9DE|nr:glycosyl hydrolase family 8 [Rhodoblastus acidophilus]MCW2285477.1 endoglucanase [Rhodoblastus acidophilus]MCW2334439.1 endoglucanase [Rhodoblastus acidophilus]
MRLIRLAMLALAAALAFSPAHAQPVEDAPLDLDATEKKLGGALKAPELWALYKARFISESGRVMDSANGGISHSEGQGYGMLFAVAADDRAAFDRIWGWTRANLMVRDDQLLAWRWEPNARPAVADMNDASDGDILVAWALVEAAERWNDLSYRIAARRVAVEVGRKLLLLGGKDGPLLLPAVAGFSKEDRADGPIVNLSYWVFPAFARLPRAAPEVDWAGLTQSGLALLRASKFGAAGLPADWQSFVDGVPAPAKGFAPAFSYDAIRIPLYMAMAGVGERAAYAPFLASWERTGAVAAVDLGGGGERAFGEPGYEAVAALAQCAVQGKKLPGDFAAPRPGQNYYPATLQMLAVIAAQTRYASCARS